MQTDVLDSSNSTPVFKGGERGGSLLGDFAGGGCLAKRCVRRTNSERIYTRQSHLPARIEIPQTVFKGTKQRKRRGGKNYREEYRNERGEKEKKKLLDV